MPIINFPFKFFRLHSDHPFNLVEMLRGLVIRPATLEEGGRTRKIRTDHYRLGQFHADEANNRLFFGDFIRIMTGKTAFKSKVSEDKITAWHMENDEGLTVGGAFCYHSGYRILCIQGGGSVPAPGGVMDYINKFTPGYTIYSAPVPNREALDRMANGSIGEFTVSLAEGALRNVDLDGQGLQELANLQAQMENCVMEVRFKSTDRDGFNIRRLFPTLQKLIGLHADDKVDKLTAKGHPVDEQTNRVLDFIQGKLTTAVPVDSLTRMVSREEMQRAARRAWNQCANEIQRIFGPLDNPQA